LAHLQSRKLLELQDGKRYLTSKRGQKFLSKWKELKALL
jgi:hypothetical protein